MAYIERKGRTRDVLFAAAMDAAAKDGKVWNDLSGEERNVYVAGIEQAWIAADAKAVAAISKQVGPDGWANLPFDEKVARLEALDAPPAVRTAPVDKE